MRSQPKLPHRCLSPSTLKPQPESSGCSPHAGGSSRAWEESTCSLKAQPAAIGLEGKDVAADGNLQREAAEGGSFPDLKATGQPCGTGRESLAQEKSEHSGSTVHVCSTLTEKPTPSHGSSPGTRGLALPRHTGQPSGTEEVQTRVLEESASILKLFPSTSSPERRLCNVLVGAPAPLRC